MCFQKSLQAQSAAGKIDGIAKKTSEDGTNYVADVSAGSKSFTVTVDAGGAAVSREETVALEDVPESVQKTIKDLQGKLLGISKTTVDSETSYTADLLRGDKRYPVEVAADGKVIPDDQ